MATLSWLDVVVIALYFAMMIAISVYYAKKMVTVESFAVADKSLSMKIMIGTTVATCMGAASAIGNVGQAYKMGISFLLVFSAWHIGWIALILMSKRLRASEAKSLPEFLFMRYGKTTRWIASIITLVFLINATAAQTAGVGTIFSTFHLLSFETGVIIGGLAIILYTVFGGLYAVAVTDTIQAILLIVGVVIMVPIVAYHEAGGVGYVLANSAPETFSFANVDFFTILGLILAYWLAAGSHTAYSQRIFASKDLKTAFWGSIWSDLIAFAAGAVIVLAVFTAPFIFPDMTNGETFVPRVIITYFPPVLKGFVIAGLLGLVISTADSFLLMIGTTIVEDIYKIFKPDLDAKQTLKYSRIFTVVGGICCLILAIYGGGVFNLFKTGSAAYGAGMFIPLFLGCFWKRASAKGVNVGMLAGCFVTILWNLVGLKAATGIDGVIIGAAACLVLVVVLSLALKPEKGEVLKQ